jgi:Zn ribbon nucleic-acid-binding protein
MKKQIIKAISAVLIFVLTVFSLTACFIEIPDGDDEDTSHTHAFEEGADESFYFKECTICGYKIDKRPIADSEKDESEHIHNNSWVIDVEPTYTSSGIKHMECNVCGYKSKENTVVDRFISNEEINDGVIDPSMGSCVRFDDFDELDSFCKQNENNLEGSFLCLDLSSAGEEGIFIHEPFTYSTYTFDYEEKNDDKYVNSRLVSDYEFYSEELGSDTDVNEDVLYHSMTLKFISNPQIRIENELRYEFFSYKSEKKMWNYVIKIYDGDNCVAHMYYYTKLDIEREWLVSFLDKYIVRIDINENE